MTDTVYRHPDIERLDGDGIAAIQRRKLAAMGARLDNNPQWVEHFRGAGMRPRDLADPQALAAAPFMEKADLRARYPFPMLTVGMAAVERFCATSGTTGPPVLFGSTRRDVETLLAEQVARVFTAAGLTARDLVYQGHGYGMWIGGLSMEAGLAAIGATIFPLGPGRGGLAVEWLRDLAFTACIMSPLWIIRLTEIARRQGIDPRRDWRLRLGLFGGQAVARAVHDRIEASLPAGFAARNVYGTTEAGGPVLAVACPYAHARDEMHLINEDTIITEIVDPENLTPVAPGEVGEIVITTLDKQASPVLRWRTRDLVRRSAAPHDCACGRHGMPLIGRIIGRSDDMLKIRGTIVFPSQVEEVIAAASGTVKDAWQIYVDRREGVLGEATVAIERAPDAAMDADRLREAVARSLRDRLGVTFIVTCAEEGTLPRYEAKAQRVLTRE